MTADDPVLSSPHPESPRPMTPATAPKMTDVHVEAMKYVVDEWNGEWEDTDVMREILANISQQVEEAKT